MFQRIIGTIAIAINSFFLRNLDKKFIFCKIYISILQKMNFLSRFLKKNLAVQKKFTLSMLDCWSIGRKDVNNKTLLMKKAIASKLQKFFKKFLRKSF